MEFYYKTNDWDQLEAGDPNFIEVRGCRIPYAVFENVPEKTLDPKLIDVELGRATAKLWRIIKH